MCNISFQKKYLQKVLRPNPTHVQFIIDESMVKANIAKARASHRMK